MVFLLGNRRPSFLPVAWASRPFRPCSRPTSIGSGCSAPSSRGPGQPPAAGSHSSCSWSAVWSVCNPDFLQTPTNGCKGLSHKAHALHRSWDCGHTGGKEVSSHSMHYRKWRLRLPNMAQPSLLSSVQLAVSAGAIRRERALTQVL